VEIKTNKNIGNQTKGIDNRIHMIRTDKREDKKINVIRERP
jgi:hypothetical protein